MTGGVGMAVQPARAHVTGSGREAVLALIDQLQRGLRGGVATAVLYFASSRYDPTVLAGPIAAAFPDAAVIGCSTAGEFTDQVMGTGGISAVALPYGILTGAVAALAELSLDAAGGTWAAIEALEASLDLPLRDLDPASHVSFVLIDGVHGCEEVVNAVLGNAAPVLDVVGGSAGDDLAFRSAWVAVGEHVSYQGAAVMVCQSGVPFQVLKTCAFRSTGRRLRITDADVASRTVLAFDHQPAALAYARAVGVPVAQLDASILIRHPVGQMIDGEPWIRSPRAVHPDGAITFFGHVLPGTEVELMQPIDLVADTRAALAAAYERLGGRASGAVIFNCILRRLEIDAREIGPAFLDAFDQLPLAGFQTYGPTWLGHINQSMTGIVFG